MLKYLTISVTRRCNVGDKSFLVLPQYNYSKDYGDETAIVTFRESNVAMENSEFV